MYVLLQRTNSLLSLNVVNGSWSNVSSCSGDIPSPRAHHAACAMDNFMFIHGGEGSLNSASTAQVTFQPTTLPVEVKTIPSSSNVVDQTTPSITELNNNKSQQLYTINESQQTVASSSWDGGRMGVDGDRESEDRFCGMVMDGVCPGDTLGERITAAVNVSTSYATSLCAKSAIAMISDMSCHFTACTWK